MSYLRWIPKNIDNQKKIPLNYEKNIENLSQTGTVNDITSRIIDQLMMLIFVKDSQLILMSIITVILAIVVIILILKN